MLPSHLSFSFSLRHTVLPPTRFVPYVQYFAFRPSLLSLSYHLPLTPLSCPFLTKGLYISLTSLESWTRAIQNIENALAGQTRWQFSSFCLTPTSKSRRQPETRRDARKWSRCRVSSNSIERFGDGLPLRMEKRRNGAGVCNLRSSENRYRLSRSFDSFDCV